jgi:hypothetical protein
MEKSVSSQGRAIRVIRWTALALSALFIVMSLIFFVGEGVLAGRRPNPQPISNNAILQLSISGVCLLGLALAWWWKLIGGATALAAFIILGIVNPEVLVTPPLLIVPLTALLFLVSWWMSRPHTKPVSSEKSKSN